ncbi:MAG TPA: tetratricopeptide repeat protein [Malonomonas sp.]
MIVVALFMFVFIAFAIGFLVFWGNNPGDITVFLTSEQSFTLPTAITLICAVLLGLLLGNGVHIFSSLVHSIGHWRGGRKQKKAEEVSAIYRSGVARLLAGDLKKARTLLRKSLDRDSKRVDGYLALASVAEQEGNSQEAIDLLQQARKLDPKGLEILFKLAATFQGAGRSEESLVVYKELLANDGENRKAMRALRDLQMEQGNWQDALALQKKIVKLTSSGPKVESEKQLLLQLRYEVARNALNNGDAEQAVDTCKDLIKQAANFTPARVTLGDAHRELKRDADAIRVYQDGYKALQKSVFLSRLEDLYIGAEDPAALLAFYRSQMQADSGDLLLKLYLGRLCLRLEMVDEALQHLSDLEASGIEFPQLHLLLAEAHRRRRKVDLAVVEYQRALGIDSHLSLGFVCEQCGAKHAEWLSRCPACKAWDTLVLPERKQIQDAKLFDGPKAIPHGQREV